jgi:cell division protein FtsB
MITRTRLRTVLTAIGLYVGAALLIGYFGVNAYTGPHGLKAKQDLLQQIGELTAELDRLKRERASWEHRVSLLRPAGLDPDLLDERARTMLDYMHPHELTMMLKARASAPTAAAAR